MAKGSDGEIIIFDSNVKALEGYEKEVKAEVLKFKAMTPEEQDEYLKTTAIEVTSIRRKNESMIEKALKEAEAKKFKSPATK